MLSDPSPPVASRPVGEALASASVDAVPKAEVPAKPETCETFLDCVVGVPKAETPAKPLTPI